MTGMKTVVADVRELSGAAARKAVDWAGELIRDGGIVGFPTETVYGLGASSFDDEAVRAVYAAKGRPADNPLISHVNDREAAEALGRFTPLAEQLAAAFWPGPLTLVLEKTGPVAPVVTAGLPSVAVRCPSHPAARALIAAAGLPIAAPSANKSGRPSPTLASHVYEDLAGRVPLILDGGPVDIGVESTVVDVRGELPVLLRPGRVTREQLTALCGGCLLPDKKASDRPASPGMKYRHYAPQGQLLLATDWRAVEALRERLLAADATPPLLLLSEESAAELVRRGLPAEQMLVLGPQGDCGAYAHRLFAALREADSRQASRLIAETVPEDGLGLAVMNRLNKAAANEPPVRG